MNKQQLEEIVVKFYKEGYTDIHLTGKRPLAARKDRQTHFFPQINFTPEQIDALVKDILTTRQLNYLRENWALDIALTIQNIRLRVNIFSCFTGLSLAIRFLPFHIPGLEELNLHPCLQKFTFLDSGLVIFCGSTGSGKTTTIASLLNEINQKRHVHIITLEDPIEYIFNPQKAFIQQRELGTHFHSYQQGLINALREAPDVIFIGEMRQPETISLTLDAAQSGHLLFTTLHASTPEEAIYRICNSFPAHIEHFVRFQLSSCLKAIVVQKLVYKKELGFSVPHLTILINTKPIKNLIRENKLNQIKSIMQTSSEHGIFTEERYEEFLREKKEILLSPGSAWQNFQCCKSLRI
ncbi:MAG: Twitching motility protein [Desulfonauticus sp. 38_4375]|nr:MAG: Twitching motility protein [Desulfonauticus sp. 38_4375]